MSYVDGVGDEVLGLLVSVLATFLVAVLWKTTQVRDAPPIHHVVIQGDRIRAFGFSTNPAAANRARTSSSATNSTTDGASEDQNLQFHPTTTIPLPSSPTSQNEDGDQGSVTTEEEELSGSEGGSGVESESINIKLRFLDESELDVTTKLSECLRRFRRRHLDSHLSLSPTDKVKLIFNGKIIHRDGQTLSEAGIYDNCTVHCLVQRVDPATASPSQQSSGSSDGQHQHSHNFHAGGGANDPGSDLDLQTLCFPLLGTILFGCWWFALFYSQNFTMLSLTSLVSLTVLYAASVANLMLY